MCSKNLEVREVVKWYNETSEKKNCIRKVLTRNEWPKTPDGFFAVNFIWICNNKDKHNLSRITSEESIVEFWSKSLWKSFWKERRNTKNSLIKATKTNSPLATKAHGSIACVRSPTNFLNAEKWLLKCIRLLQAPVPTRLLIYKDLQLYYLEVYYWFSFKNVWRPSPAD